MAREQPKTSEKPDYGQCFVCGLHDHWAPNCPQKDETSRKTTNPVENSGKSNKRKLSCEEDMSVSTPRKQRKVEKVTAAAEPKRAKRKRIPKKKYCFVCKSDTHGAKDCKEVVIDSDEELKESLSKLKLN